MHWWQILIPQIELTDTQLVKARGLRQSCEQAEEALSQGMEKLQQTLAQSITIDITGAGSYTTQMNCALERLEALEIFLNQVKFEISFDRLLHSLIGMSKKNFTGGSPPATDSATNVSDFNTSSSSKSIACTWWILSTSSCTEFNLVWSSSWSWNFTFMNQSTFFEFSLAAISKSRDFY